MAKDKKISQVSVADKVAGDELLPFAKNGDNGAITTGTILAKANATAKSYADTAETNANKYTDTAKANAINSANEYTNSKLEPIKQAQNEDLAKITELAGKLNGIDNVQDELNKKANVTDVDVINEKIPSQASASNQLADKDFVNSSIATNTATFKGTYNTFGELEGTNADANDYGFVRGKDSEGNTVYNRYKYVEGEGWLYEYSLNNSSFTAAQWETINSGITVNSFDALETLAESVNQGLGETIQRVDNLETSLAADKTNLANFKQHVEADFVKDVDYNDDKATIMGEIMKKADKSYVQQVVDSELGAASGQLEVLNEIKAYLDDDADIANAVTKEIAEAKKQVFIDLWNEACSNFGDDLKTVGRYNPDTGFFELNGLTDITYEQAVAIYSKTSGLYYVGGNSSRNCLCYGATTIRTNLPISYKTNWYTSLEGCFHGCSEMEVLYLPGAFLSGMSIMQKLHTLTIAGIRDATCTNNMPMLKNITFIGDNNGMQKRCDKSFAKSELLTRVSVANVVAKEPAVAQAVTFTMHPTVYAALMGEAETYPVNEGSREEWGQLLQDALAKNIQFVSA